jgi:hypothetical protein
MALRGPSCWLIKDGGAMGWEGVEQSTDYCPKSRLDMITREFWIENLRFRSLFDRSNGRFGHTLIRVGTPYTHSRCGRSVATNLFSIFIYSFSALLRLPRTYHNTQALRRRGNMSLGVPAPEGVIAGIRGRDILESKRPRWWL